MKKYLLFTLPLAFTLISACTQTTDDTVVIIEVPEEVAKTEDNNDTERHEYHKLQPTGVDIYDKTYYTLDYSEEHEQASWVYYLLTADFINGSAERKDNFRADLAISTQSAGLNDYSGSGYDRGHLCPAADMTLNENAMSESFYLSNMSPQLPGLNRGQWKSLEAQVRNWALQEDSLLVVTGPIFNNNIEKIGTNQVTVPGYYYKVLYDITPPQKMTAFIMPHIDSPNAFATYQTTVDEVEKQTGIDFFVILDDENEAILESDLGWE